MEKIEDGVILYNGVNLQELAKEYGTPLKVTFLDVIKMRVNTLKEAFDSAINELNYSGKFIYLNANKANYGLKEVETAFINSDGLETSSYYDLLFTYKLYKKHPEFKNKLIVSNGYKEDAYLNAINEVDSKGYHIIDVIDSIDEYERLKALDKRLEVGLRIHISSQYAEGDEPKDDRFGLMDDEYEYIINDIKNTKLVLSTIHFHQRGFDYEEDKFEKNFMKVFENYYVKANKLYDSVINFDMGGGTPLPTSNDFDYKNWAKYVIGLLQKASNKYEIKEPNLISENGKYSQKDSTVNIYKVIAKKKTGEYPWYVVNGSLLIALPEMYALGEPIEVKPINELNKPMVEARLAGVTCDCDDVLYNKEKGYILLPDTNNDLYIGCMGTGSYQNSMNGKRGVHHCMLPEEKDIIIETIKGKQKINVRNDLQTIKEIMKLV